MATSITPATSPTADPNIPAEARPATIDGAQKFAAFWVAQFNLALRTADPALIAPISATQCASCQGFISEAAEFNGRGEHLEGDLWTVTQSEIDSFDRVSTAVVVTTTNQHPVARVDGNGSVVLRYKERTEDLAFTLHHDGTAWTVANLQVVK